MDGLRFVGTAPGVRLAVESFGRVGDPLVVMVMGATAGRLGWPEALCRQIAAAGLRVLRFDHRDTGRTGPVAPGYAVEDMAADVVALIASEGAAAAHLVGMSLGGTIAQMLAAGQPERVLSLTLIATEPLGWTGPQLPWIDDAFLELFGRIGETDWSDREAALAVLTALDALCAGSRHGHDPAEARARIGAVLDDALDISAAFRHGGLTMREDWTGRLADVTAPTLVIHGGEDRVLPVENGRALAGAIAGARLELLDGVGHELPAAELPRLAAAIATHIGKARIRL